MSGYGNIWIDGQDAWLAFGLVVSKGGLANWLAFPERKTPLSHDWADENGIEVDLEKVYFKEKNVSLPVYLVAGSSEQFWMNYNSLENLLMEPGMRQIKIGAFDWTFGAYYTKCDGVTKPTWLRGTDKIVVGMTLHFVIPADVAMGDYLYVTPTDVVFPASGGERNLEVESNLRWTVMVDVGDYLYVSPTDVIFPASGGERNIEVESNLGWTIMVDAEEIPTATTTTTP